MIVKGHHYFKHDYRAVLKHGAELFMRAMNDCFTATGATVSDIDLFIPHQVYDYELLILIKIIIIIIIIVIINNYK